MSRIITRMERMDRDLLSCKNRSSAVQQKQEQSAAAV